MKLRYSPASPFARKCAMAAHALGLAHRIELIGNDKDVGDALRSRNPLGKVPMLIADDGAAIFDSVVIVEFLDHLAGGGVIPVDPKERFPALVMQALADGVMDAAVLIVYESRFREDASKHSPRWLGMQQRKIDTGLDALEEAPPPERVDVGTIAVAAALGFLDFRFKGAWRETRPRLVRWFESYAMRMPGFAETQPKD